MLVIPRLRGAIDGFRQRYGHWPTRLYVDPDTLHAHSESASADEEDTEGDDDVWELLAWIGQRVSVIGQAGAQYRAEDEAGNQYDYGTEGFSGDAMTAGELLQTWRSTHGFE